MNKNSVLSDERYFNFSKLFTQKEDMFYEEFNQFTENPLWIELYADLDEYGPNRELLASFGLKFNEKKYIFSFLAIMVLYFSLILIIILG